MLTLMSKNLVIFYTEYFEILKQVFITTGKVSYQNENAFVSTFFSLNQYA